MGLNTEIENFFTYSKETEEGFVDKTKIYGRSFLMGGADVVTPPDSTILLPASGMNNDGVTGDGLIIPQDCEIVKMKVGVLQNTFTDAEITFLFVAADKDSNIIYFEPFWLFLPGETGFKTIDNKIFSLPEGSIIYIFISTTETGTGTANTFRWSGVFDIIR
jgi:hypothetical protein